MPDLEQFTTKEIISELKTRENLEFVLMWKSQNREDWAGMSFSPWLRAKNAASLLEAGADYLRTIIRDSSGESDF